ncbi:biotin carboxyl carrier protein [Pacificibacter maritimus]|uniref:Biotin carboxyl carrier protein of acetyl-CoA carboxylase n=1 Tax=Pacificibacter maritimus TaxID=762213 RepID=A0A3N4UHA4_9RHOB|nr:acetyl-CoA carboxylase biotin carboxyl carrier protein subunit [Pacificibacter maritimus]RPE66559.1 biotin carboxyl carrier protein [Pacificibacter maritimus]
MPIEIEAIIAQMEWAAARGLSEFSTSTADTDLSIRRSVTSQASGQGAVPYSPQPTVDTAQTATATKTPTIDAPMAGCCHLSSESDGTVFVREGDTIELGQTLCMIEAMKVMTSITATQAGTVKAILVEDGDQVDAGTALFEVQP